MTLTVAHRQALLRVAVRPDSGQHGGLLATSHTGSFTTVVIPVLQDLIAELVAPDDGCADMPTEDRVSATRATGVAQLAATVLGQPVPQGGNRRILDPQGVRTYTHHSRAPGLSAKLASFKEEVDALTGPAAVGVASQQLARTPQLPREFVK
jgi:hypothetical protein